MQQIDNSLRKQIIFNYDALATPERYALQQAARSIRADIDTTIRGIWNIGQNLVEVRRRLEDDTFDDWLQSEFEWSRRTAYNYIKVYQAFPDLYTQKHSQLDIDLCALYLLAAPSTSSELRSHFLEIAQSGQRVRHKDVKASVERMKALSIAAEDRVELAAIAEDTIASPRLIMECHDEEKPQQPVGIDRSISALYPAWNLVNENFSLYWGDIAAPRFNKHLPDEAFVLATPTVDWQQAWLGKNTRSAIIAINQQQLDRQMVSGFLATIANGQKAIVFPWLPDWQIVKIALDLNLTVYAADTDLRRCERLLAKLGLDLQRIARIWT